MLTYIADHLLKTFYIWGVGADFIVDRNTYTTREGVEISGASSLDEVGLVLAVRR